MYDWVENFYLFSVWIRPISTNCLVNCLRVCIRIYLFMNTHASTERVCVCVHVCKSLCLYIYIYIYIYIVLIYILISHTHTQTYISMFINIYIHYQSKVSGHPQKSLSKNVIFKEKINHLDVFIYYAKYKSSSVTLIFIKPDIVWKIDLKRDIRAEKVQKKN